MKVKFFSCGVGDGVGTLEPTRVQIGPMFSCGVQAPARGSLKQEASSIHFGYGFMRPFHTSPRG